MKRIELYCVLLFVVCLCIFTGCKSKESTSQQITTTETSVQTDTGTVQSSGK